MMSKYQIRQQGRRRLGQRLAHDGEDVQLHYVDYTPGITLYFDTIGAVDCLNEIGKGFGVTERIKDRVYLRGFLLRGLITTGGDNAICKGSMMIIYDRRPNGALPLITDILTTIDSVSFLNDANAGRFQIMWRYDFCTAGNDRVSAFMDYRTSQSAKLINVAVDLRRSPTQFTPAGPGLVSDMVEGSLLIVTVGHSAFASGSSRIDSPVGRLYFETCSY